MIPGFSGRLISSSFAADVLPDQSGIDHVPIDVARGASRWNAVREAALGPASSVRAVADLAAGPLAEWLGFRITARRDAEDRCELRLSAGGTSIPALVAPWSHALDAIWRDAVRSGVSSDARWCICTNGRALRIIDTQRTWSRHYIEFDLASVAHVPETLRILWTLARADAMAGSDPLLDRFVELSARHGTSICRILADGVLDALSIVLQALSSGEPCGRPRPMPALLEQSLTVLYRVLFLLFAEARGLVPVWHPIYRDRYTIESIVAALAAGRRYRGVWQTLQAIARLAHAGCRAGDLHVTAFNGRLFSPLHTPAAERRRIDDEAIGRALLAVGTAPASPARAAGRARIRYRNLDVEQLGGGVRACSRLRSGTRWAFRVTAARRRREEVERHVLHAAVRHRLPGSSNARAARARQEGRRDSQPARRRSGDGKRRLSGSGVPLPGRGRRGGVAP